MVDNNTIVDKPTESVVFLDFLQFCVFVLCRFYTDDVEMCTLLLEEIKSLKSFHFANALIKVYLIQYVLSHVFHSLVFKAMSNDA